MSSTLFAVSLLVGEGGDGCLASGMSRISADARRLFDENISSPFGLQIRDSGTCSVRYDETGRSSAVSFRIIWERVYIRVRKYPTSGNPDPVVWALKGSIEGTQALFLRLDGSGNLKLYNQGNSTAPGSLLASVGIAIGVWCCVEFNVVFNDAVAPANNAYIAWRIDGNTIFSQDRSGVSPQYGIDKSGQKASESQLGGSTGKGLEIDYADWIADSADWVGLHRRVAVLRATAIGVHDDWTGGNPDYRHQLDFPFPDSGVNLGVSTSTAGASQSYVVESPSTKGIDAPFYSARIAIFFATVGGGSVSLILRRNGTDTIYNIGQPPTFAWSTWRVDASGWSPSDTLEIGVVNTSSPATTTRIDACALLLEHATPSVSTNDDSVRILQTTYTGNGTQQSIVLSSLDPDVALLTPSVIFAFPESGTQPGAWWWDSKVYPTACSNARRISYAIVAGRGVVHITGSSGSTNQNNIPYRLIALFDPKSRIVTRGAVALSSNSDDRDVIFRNSTFMPEALFVVRESANQNDSTKAYYRGAGHTGDMAISLGANIAAVADAIQDVQSGEFQVGTLANEAFQDFAFMAWRTAPFTGARLIAVASYAGNGTNPRNVPLGLDGGTPIFALVVPTDTGRRWMRHGSVTRQFGGNTTGSANAITAFGADSLTVGSELNANAVVYSVFALVAGVDVSPFVVSLAFGGGAGLIRDDATTFPTPYQTPQWQNDPLASYPYLYKEGESLVIADARFVIPDHLTGATYHIRGTGLGGVNIPSTAATQVFGDVFQITNAVASSPFPSGTTSFYEAFTILWEVSRDSGGSWQSAGSTTNTIYVCLSDPTSLPAERRLHTVVYLACGKSGATDADSAVLNTWDLFSSGSGPINVRRVSDGSDLFYYRPLTAFDQNVGGFGHALLAALNRSGQCSTWADLLLQAWLVNGVQIECVKYVTATVDGGHVFFVKAWDDLTTSHPFWFQDAIPDMIPPPLTDNPYAHYDDPNNPQYFLNERTAPGQGTAGTLDCPSQKAFGNHQFLKYKCVYYDPSYGVTYADEAAFQARLDGYGTVASTGIYLKINFHNFVGVQVKFKEDSL